MATTDTTVSNLIINKLTKTQYDNIQNPSDTELYLVPDVVDNAPTSGSSNYVTSGGVYTALSTKADSSSIPDAVSGTNDGTNWTSITIGSTTKAIPSGGGGGEANVIESISINGTTQTVTSKNVDLPVPTSTAVYQIVSISQSAYDALVSGGTVSSTTLYLITS